MSKHKSKLVRAQTDIEIILHIPHEPKTANKAIRDEEGEAEVRVEVGDEVLVEGEAEPEVVGVGVDDRRLNLTLLTYRHTKLIIFVN